MPGSIRPPHPGASLSSREMESVCVQADHRRGCTLFRNSDGRRRLGDLIAWRVGQVSGYQLPD
jgi:hypothetical protein